MYCKNVELEVIVKSTRSLSLFIYFLYIDIFTLEKKIGAVTTKVEIFKGRALTLPSVPQLTIEIPAITLSIEYDKKISITTLVLIVLEIARMILKQILEEINEVLVEEYCGKKYEGERIQKAQQKERFQRYLAK